MGSSSTYEDAKRKEKKAEETSDLATEEEGSQKRKRKPPRHILSSSEDEQESEPVAQHGHGNPQASISTFIPTPAPPKMPLPQSQQPPSSSSADVPGAKRKRTVQLFLKLSGFQAEVLRLLGGIAAQLQSQAKILRQLEAQRHEPKKPTTIPAVLHLLPLSSHEDVAQLETLLQEDENKEALIAHLALIGGSSVQDVTRSVMKRCMLDALAKNYCMTGRKGKLRMEHLQLVCVVTGAVHRCFEQKKKNGEEAIVVQKNTTLKAIADWLRYAAARVKKTEGAASA
ncbi:uncharacterized protein LOC120846959 isoform X1 [Ixodes scapularis]|uniref:uncharacterized protein LOC120846959 isoform X1 n=1 Tax=Ixodes scapularis TaxID=6945 RepID=UPI001AA00266|nr:uncharacterized protein LOC120846959 isoform X1 [Ixodes scapularis]